MRAHLDELIDAGEFTRRHTSPTEDERKHMLSVIGEDSVESLLAHTVPSAIRMTDGMQLGAPAPTIVPAVAVMTCPSNGNKRTTRGVAASFAPIGTAGSVTIVKLMGRPPGIVATIDERKYS